MAISKIIYKSSPQDTGTVWMDATPATALAADISAGKTALLANGVMTTGTGSGGGQDALMRYEKLTSYATAEGWLTPNGTIDTSVSGGVIRKYELPEDVTSIAINGTSTLYVPGNHYAVYWFVDNDTMMDYYSPVSEPEVFYNDVIEVPEGATEFWSTEVVPSVKSQIMEPVDKLDGYGGQWKGKLWFAYGTSITETSTTGRYPLYLAKMSGMRLIDKGIGGGGIGNLGGYSTGQVYNAICNITDGKTSADLITLETGANDEGASVPLGAVYDTGTSTLAGCLNDCLRYLQTNTHAQIAVTYSPASTTAPNATDKYYEWEQMVERICRINRVHYISPANGMGYAKLTSSSGSLYVEDNIHQTNLGGYIMAENIWYQLRNIPLFYTELPTGNDSGDEPSGQWETVIEGTAAIDNDGEGHGYIVTSLTSFTPITQNSVWRVTWNGVPYTMTAIEQLNYGSGYEASEGYAVGNIIPWGGATGNNEPFAMSGFNFWGQHTLTFVTVASSGTASFLVEKQVTA